MPRPSTYQLVRSEASKLLEKLSEKEKRTLLDEISYRIDSVDESLDTVFMKVILAYLNGDTDDPVKIEVNPLKYSGTHPSTYEATFTPADEFLLKQERERGLEEGEEIFKSTGKDFSKPELSRYGVAGRYPRFLNKVRHGVVWNRYGQTHYDEQNPPPKQVIGYKFNIFYPELQDRQVAPKYKIEASDSRDTLLLRFTAGAPYEDLVFKIVNKEWDLDRRSGFTCQFERGVLQLYFVLKKETYRR